MRIASSFRLIYTLLFTAAAWLCEAQEPIRAAGNIFETKVWETNAREVANDYATDQLSHDDINTGRHYDPNARLRSRTQQLRQSAQNNHTGSITHLSPVCLAICPRAFNSIPRTNYQQPHLLYSYRLFLF